MGGGRLYTYRYTVTTRMTSALRWAAMRAILMFQQEVTDKVTRQCPQTTTLEEKGEPKRIRTEVPLLTSLTPYRQAKPAHTRYLALVRLVWSYSGLPFIPWHWFAQFTLIILVYLLTLGTVSPSLVLLWSTFLTIGIVRLIPVYLLTFGTSSPILVLLWSTF